MSVSGDSTSLTWGLEADLVMTRGLINIMNRDRPVAGALAVKGERVVAIGQESEVGPLIGGGTFVVDLDGRVVIPGLTDCHVHVAGQAAVGKLI